MLGKTKNQSMKGNWPVMASPSGNCCDDYLEVSHRWDDTGIPILRTINNAPSVHGEVLVHLPIKKMST